jgi:hypothetical protein
MSSSVKISGYAMFILKVQSYLCYLTRGRRGRDRKVVGFTPMQSVPITTVDMSAMLDGILQKDLM